MTRKESEEKIIELLDIKFLEKLLEVGKLYGWQGDYVEIGEFISNLHTYKGMRGVDVEPYEITEDTENESLQ